VERDARRPHGRFRWLELAALPKTPGAPVGAARRAAVARPSRCLGALGHSTTQITRDIYLSVMPQVAQAAAEAPAAIVPRTDRRQLHEVLCTRCPPTATNRTATTSPEIAKPGQEGWGGRDSNPRPRDYELDPWGVG
jgi:hypothetical protein